MFRARGLWSAALLCATMQEWPAPASLQGYPAWPIKLVVPFSPDLPSYLATIGRRLSKCSERQGGCHGNKNESQGETQENDRRQEGKAQKDG